jgi:hypothetical protein
VATEAEGRVEVATVAKEAGPCMAGTAAATVVARVAERAVVTGAALAAGKVGVRVVGRAVERGEATEAVVRVAAMVAAAMVAAI